MKDRGAAHVRLVRQASSAATCFLPHRFECATVTRFRNFMFLFVTNMVSLFCPLSLIPSILEQINTSFQQVFLVDNSVSFLHSLCTWKSLVMSSRDTQQILSII